jgi:hypothetical protein
MREYLDYLTCCLRDEEREGLEARFRKADQTLSTSLTTSLSLTVVKAQAAFLLSLKLPRVYAKLQRRASPAQPGFRSAAACAESYLSIETSFAWKSNSRRVRYPLAGQALHARPARHPQSQPNHKLFGIRSQFELQSQRAVASLVAVCPTPLCFGGTGC